MAEIIVTDTSVNLNVTTTQSNITVTDLETNVTVNVASLNSNISVTSTPVNVTIAPSIGVSNSEVRAALGNTNPILYDATTGIFSFDADAAFDNAKVIGAIQSGNVILKQVQETYFDAGNVTSTTMNLDLVNGTIQKVTLQSNVEQISVANLSPGGSFTVFIEQDSFGFRLLDTSTNFNDWLFVDDFKTLSVGAGNVDSLSVIFDGSTYYASLVKLNSSDIDATFDNVTVRYNTIANVLIANAVTINTSLGLTGPLTSTSTANITGAVTLGNNLNVGGQLFADGEEIYIGQPGTGTVKSINAYSSTTAGQLYYNGADNTWYFRNNTSGGAIYKLPTSTTDLAEGANLYFSTSRANSAIQDYKGTITTQGNITTTANVQGNYLLGNGAFITGVVGLSNSQVLSYIATQPLTVGGNLTVNGNINATGNINVQNVEDLYVRDQTILLNANAASPANVQIVSNRPGFANTELKWNEQTDRWTFTNDGTTYYNLATSTTDVPEGANLYYTTARANTAIGAYQGNINTIGSLTVGSAEINGNLVLDPIAGNANIVGQSTQDDLTVAFENIELKIGSDNDEGRLYVKEHEGPALLSLSGAETDNNRLRVLGDVIIGVDPNSSNTTGQFVFDVAQGDLDVQGGIEAETLFGNTAISSIDGNIFTTNGNISTTNGYLNGNARFATGIITTNVTEGANLYFTTARVDDHLNTATATTNQVLSWTGTDYDWVSGGSGTVTQINTGENLTGGPITTTGTIGLANALSNVYSVTTDGQDFTINTNSKLILTEQLKNVTTYTGNINGDGYAVFTGSTNYTDVLTHTGANALNSYGFLTGNTTSGSNVITGVSLEDSGDGNPASISSVTPYYVFSYIGFSRDQYPFPPGTYVTSVDAGNSTITMSQPASATVALTYPSPYTTLIPGAYDAATGLLIGLLSEYTINGTGSRSTIEEQLIVTTGAYGYPATGPAPSDFVYSIDTASNYTAGIIDTSKLIARTNIVAPRTVLSAPRGLVVGDSDLTNRAENDSIASFGVNILWDGSSTSGDYAGGTPLTQILVKNYTDNNLQGSGTTALNRVAAGPRLFFTAAEGNKDQPYQITYPRNNLELGRIAWWCGTNETVGLGSQVPPAFISVVTNRDMTGSHNGGVGMYLSASPNTDAGRRGLFAAHQLGNTLIASGNATTTGASQPITFAPMWTSAAQSATGGSNAVAQFNNTLAATNYQWATINYDNASGKTGSRLSVTNGVSTVSGRNGNLVLALDRNDNGAGFGSKEWAFKLQPGSTDLVLTEDDVIRTTFSGANITTSGNISAGNTIVNGVSFNTAGTTAPSSGQIVYNSNYGSHQVGLNGSNVMIMGQDLVVYARNDEANTLLKGEVVFISGASGDKATIKRAINNSDANSATTIGIVKSDIATGQLGYVVSQGVVDGLNLGGYTAGDKLYLGNVAGTFTNIKPSSPEHYVFIGVVERANAGNGQVLVRVQNGFELDEIHDIKLTNVQQNDMLIRNVGNSLWVNQSVSSVVANTNVTLKQFSETRVALGNVTGDQSSNINLANGSIFTMTATGNLTISSVTGAVAGSSATLIITQDGTGGKTLTSTMKFAGASKTLSTAAGAIDIISLFYDGTTYYATLSKGYA
jgi:hypothetical protein